MATASYTLGLSAYYHDSAAALLCDGDIVAAAQEERFSRIRHDAKFPRQAILFCLKQANIKLSQLDNIVFYDKPLLKFERLLETYLAYAPRGFKSFQQAMPIWLKEKLFLRQSLRREFGSLMGNKTEAPPILFSRHHQSHAASAYFPSPFNEAAVLCLDGVGEWETSTAWLGKGKDLQQLWSIDFPHSLGLLYSAFTYYLGFKVNSGEYKLMGLAPYGKARYVDLIYQHLVEVKEDGSYRLNMEYFSYGYDLKMTNAKFNALFKAPVFDASQAYTQREMDIAKSIQVVLEEIVLKMTEALSKQTSCENLCLAGGVALNCLVNSRIKQQGLFKNIWIQPAAGDAGAALGAAYLGYIQNAPATYKSTVQKSTLQKDDSMLGAFLGPEFSQMEIEKSLTDVGAVFQKCSENSLLKLAAEKLNQGAIFGWFQGRMEFGPRALGHRSILADPRPADMQRRLNLSTKFRESFRPFAPAIMLDKVKDFYEYEGESPYMLFVAELLKKHRKNHDIYFDLKAPVLEAHSNLPAVTHIDYSARLQTVDKDRNPIFYALLEHFYALSGVPILVNTSFNVRGEPIVCTPEDAYFGFLRSDVDYLVMGPYFLDKKQQAQTLIETARRTVFEPD
ncbi:MAG: carbamoyltransferase [Oligoflexales bacterium]|nr:carbamoyltransferase [Oligoflexales bacterium]